MLYVGVVCHAYRWMISCDFRCSMNFIPVSEYADASDKALAALAASGDGEAEAALLARYFPLVRSRAAAFLATGESGFEDLCQEGMIGLLAAVRAYDSEKSSFPTFARLCIDRMLCAVHRGDTRKKRIPKTQLSVLDEMRENDLSVKLPASDVGDPESILIEREALERLKLRVQQNLTELESTLLSDYVGGRSYEEIAARHGISAKAVDNALQRIRRKLR